MRQHGRLLVFTAASLLALTVVHLFAIVMPAIGSCGYYGLTLADHPHIRLAIEGGATAPVTLALRSHVLFAPPPGPMLGLVSFPSFHTTSACLFAWLFWRTPGLRWPAALFNAGVVLSTLLDGCHYLADALAGALLAAASVRAVHRLVATIGAASPPIRHRHDGVLATG